MKVVSSSLCSCAAVFIRLFRIGCLYECFMLYYETGDIRESGCHCNQNRREILKPGSKPELKNNTMETITLGLFSSLQTTQSVIAYFSLWILINNIFCCISFEKESPFPTQLFKWVYKKLHYFRIMVYELAPTA